MPAEARPLRFGLGAAEKTDTIEVRRPGGDAQAFQNVPARRVCSIRRGEGLAF